MILHPIFSLAKYSFPVYLAYLNSKGLGEFETVMQSKDTVEEGLRNFQEFSQPPEGLDEAMQTRKKYSTAFIVKSFSKIRPDLERHNRVTYSSKHIY